MLAAAESTGSRVARLTVTPVHVGRSTAAAEAMGITGEVGSYETFYGGDPNRIHNVELVARLVDDKLIAPGTTFSFNETTGARTAEKGFLEAPVIINGELQNGLGGGVCQVSTTVFNAAYEAGLPITARTNHALYISHYPLGRDATVNYPDIDLKFVNDTTHWLLLRTFVGSSSLVATLYGTPQHRRVVSETTPLTVVSPPPVEKKLDPSLAPGSRAVVDYGQPATTPRCTGPSTRPTASCCPTTPSTRNTSRARRSSPSTRSRPPSRSRSRSPARPLRLRRRIRARRHARCNSVDQPLRRPGRPERGRVDRAVSGEALREQRPVALDGVLEAEAGAADVEAARVDEQPVVEPRRREEPHVRLDSSDSIPWSRSRW